jgi:DNA ligase-1
VQAPVEGRLDAARKVFEGVDPYVSEVLDQVQACGNDHVFSELARIELLGGEGLILRASGSPYVGGKAHRYCYKVKSRHDAEAIVVGTQAGEGKHAGRMGALVVRSEAHGSEFRIGTGFSDEEREQAHVLFPPGTRVSFKYFELNAKTGVPRFPSFWRIRPKDSLGLV